MQFCTADIHYTYMIQNYTCENKIHTKLHLAVEQEYLDFRKNILGYNTCLCTCLCDLF